MRYAIYARVSTVDKGQEVEQQLIELRRYVQDQAGELVAEYVDEASGKTAKRPQFQAMLLAAYQKKFDMLLFWSLDRFSREDVVPTLNHLEGLAQHGVKWRSHTEQYLDTSTPMGMGITAMLAALARIKVMNVREATVRALQQRKAKGVKLGRPTVAPAIIEQARTMRGDGKSYRTISATLGVPVGTLHEYLKPPPALPI